MCVADGGVGRIAVDPEKPNLVATPPGVEVTAGPPATEAESG